MSVVTLELEKGYNASVWTEAADKLRSESDSAWTPPAFSCSDDSNPDHTVLLDCNFWYMNKNSLNVKGRTVTMGVTSRAGVKEGIVLSLATGVQQSGTLVAEEMAGLIGKSQINPRCSTCHIECRHITISTYHLVQTHQLTSFLVDGMTTNGGFTFIGHNTAAPPVYNALYIVNMPTKPGFAPTVNPPTMSNGHAGDFNLCEFPPHCETYPNSNWQYTGNPRDGIEMTGTPELPASGEDAPAVQHPGKGSKLVRGYAQSCPATRRGLLTM